MVYASARIFVRNKTNNASRIVLLICPLFLQSRSQEATGWTSPRYRWGLVCIEMYACLPFTLCLDLIGTSKGSGT